MEKNRLSQLLRQGVAVANESSHIPFGSLAQAIGIACGCAITLKPLGKAGDNRAIASKVRGGSCKRPEYIIHFPPSGFTEGQRDVKVRFNVAHELAHVLLNHTPQDGFSSPNLQHELEANVLACVFMKLVGGPKERENHTFEELFSIVYALNVSEAEKLQILSNLQEALQQIQGHDLRSDFDLAQEDIDEAVPVRELRERCRVALHDFEHDGLLTASALKSLEKDFELAMSYGVDGATINITENLCRHLILRLVVCNWADCKHQEACRLGLDAGGRNRLIKIAAAYAAQLDMLARLADHDGIMKTVAQLAADVSMDIFQRNGELTAYRVSMSLLPVFGFQLKPGMKEWVKSRLQGCVTNNHDFFSGIQKSFESSARTT